MVNFTEISKYILNEVIKIGPAIYSFLNEIWLKPEWIFIFLSGVVGAYVGIKFHKKFEQKKRIHSKALIKQLVSGTFEVIVPLFFIPLLWAIGIIFTIGLIKIGISHSPNLTFILILIIGVIWYYKRKKRKEELLRRFHR